MPAPPADRAAIEAAAHRLAALMEEAVRRVKDISGNGIVEVSATGTPAGCAGATPASDSAHASMAVRALHGQFAADVETSGLVPLLFRPHGLQVVRIRVEKGSARTRELLCGPERGPYEGFGVAKARFADGLAAFARLCAAGWLARPAPDPTAPLWDLTVAGDDGRPAAKPPVHARTAEEAIRQALRTDVVVALLRGTPPIQILGASVRETRPSLLDGALAGHPLRDLIEPVLDLPEG